MAIELLRMVVDQLVVGRPLPFDVRDEHGKLLLARGQLLVSDNLREALLVRGCYVEFDDPDEPERPAAQRSTLFDLWKQSAARLDRLLASLHQPDFAARCDAFAAQLMALVQREPDIGIYVSVRQDPRRLSMYGLNHALHCALVGQLAAARAGWLPERVRTLVKAALTMNLSIVDVQGQFATLGRLNDTQRGQIRAHPQLACDRLVAAGVSDAEWLDTVLQHHEQPDGGGYPQGLAEVGEMAQVLRMVDVFMAKISPRAERPALPVQDAARQLFAESRGNPMAAAIIKEYGIYPPGNFVHLASGERAVVIRRGATAHTPLAAAVTDRRGVPVVTTHRRDTAQPPFAIRGLVPESRMVMRLPPERLYGLVA